MPDLLRRQNAVGSQKALTNNRLFDPRVITISLPWLESRLNLILTY